MFFFFTKSAIKLGSPKISPEEWNRQEIANKWTKRQLNTIISQKPFLFFSFLSEMPSQETFIISILEILPVRLNFIVNVVCMPYILWFSLHVAQPALFLPNQLFSKFFKGTISKAFFGEKNPRKCIFSFFLNLGNRILLRESADFEMPCKKCFLSFFLSFFLSLFLSFLPSFLPFLDATMHLY